jgi:hypothetical protein
VKNHKINAFTNKTRYFVRIIGEKGGKMIMKKTFKNLLLVFLLILGGVTLLACDGVGGKGSLAKDEDAFMVQAVSAANMSSGGMSLSTNQNVSLDASNANNPLTSGVELTIENALGEGLAELVNEQLKMVQDFLTNIEIKHKKNDSTDPQLAKYEKIAYYDTVDLLGVSIDYKMYYTVTEHEEEVEEDGEVEVETEFDGLLVITVGKNVRKLVVHGEVEVETDAKGNVEKELKVIHEYATGVVEISSKVEKGEREFTFKVDDNITGEIEFKLEIENKRSGVVLKIETKFEVGAKESELKLEFELKDGKNGKEVHIKLEIENLEIPIIGKIEADLEATLVVEDATEVVKLNFTFNGNVKYTPLTGAVQDLDLDFTHTLEVPKVQAPAQNENPAN